MKRIYPGYLYYRGPNLFGGNVPKRRDVRRGTIYVIPERPPPGKPDKA